MNAQMRAKIVKSEGRECVACGYCCTVTPCIYGHVAKGTARCPFQAADMSCFKHAAIVEFEGYSAQAFPMFGSGCAHPNNDLRQAKLVMDSPRRPTGAVE